MIVIESARPTMFQARATGLIEVTACPGAPNPLI